MTDTTQTPLAPTPEVTLTPPTTEASPLGGTATVVEAPVEPKSSAETLYSDEAAKPAETLSEVEGEKPAVEEKPVEEKPAGETKPLVAADYVFTSPDGFEVNEDAMGQFRDILADAQVPLAGAQKLFDTYISQQTATTKAFEAATHAAWDTTIKGWQAEREADPEIGGANKAAVDTVVGKVLDEFGDQKTRDAFDLTAAGHNPAIIKLIYQMGQALVEGGPVPGAKPAPNGNGQRRGGSLGAQIYGDD